MSSETKEWLLDLQTGDLHILDILRLGPESIYHTIGIKGIPYDRAADLIVTWHKDFKNALPARVDALMSTQSRICHHLSKLEGRIHEIETKSERVQQLGNQLRSLAEEFDEIGEAKDGLPETVSRLGDTAFWTIKADGIETMNVFSSTQSISEVVGFVDQEEAAHQKYLEQLTLSLGTIRLRLDLLKSVLHRYHLFGIVPDSLDRQSVKRTFEEIERQAENGGTTRRGRPIKAAGGVTQEDRLEVILTCLLKKEFWHVNGRHKGKPKWNKISYYLNNEHPHLVKGNSDAYPETSLTPITGEQVKAIVEDSEINLDDFRSELGIPSPK